MIPKIIHQAWVSNNDLKPEYYPWRYSWAKYNPEYTFMFWEMNNIPFDLLSPSGRELMQMKLKFTVKSDIIRWELLYLFGGIWADMDMECQKSFDAFLEHESFAGVSYYPDGIGNALVGSIAGTELVKEMRDATNREILSDIPRSFDVKRLNEAHGATFVGKNFLCRVKKIYPRHYFYPYHPVDAWGIRKSGKAYPDSYAIHKWTGASPEGWGHVAD
jgi:hypothetical protein